MLGVRPDPSTVRGSDGILNAMADGRIVYSTSVGRVCPGCGWPAKDCKCSSKRKVEERVAGRVVAKLRLEKKGRGGKTVTVVYDLPQNTDFLREPRPGAQTRLRHRRGGC